MIYTSGNILIVKKMMMELFKELLPDLLQKKEGIMTSENEKEYAPYIVNQALSFHLDCIIHANEMNINNQLDKRMQFDYYFHALRAYKRPYQQWLKMTKNDDIDAVKTFFGYSASKAKEVLKLLNKKQIDDIKSKLEKGGK